MENKKAKKYFEKLLKEYEKIKNSKGEEIANEFLTNHQVCPICKTLTIIKGLEGDTYCTKCGTIFNDVEYYESHGIEFDDGRNKKEVYVPPTNLRSKAKPFYNIGYVGKEVAYKNKSEYKKLRKIGFYVGASYSKNSQVLKRTEDIIRMSVMTSSLELRNLVSESVLMLYNKLQKRFRSWKKINIYSVIVLVGNQLGIKIDIKKLYEAENNDKISMNKFRRSINRGIERIFSILTKEEKEEIKKFMLTEIIKNSRIKNVNDSIIQDFLKTINKIMNLYPNITFYDSAKMILSRLLKNKKYKSFNEKIDAQIEKVIKESKIRLK
jgi:transcription initiation factor TFIIIB Brf1 subunit/transcription initiation factor TFIIB